MKLVGTPMLERLDYDKAPIYLEVTSEVERRLRMTACAKEVETAAFIESLTPGVFYDCGSNVGAYSFVAAVNGHRVYAFEPPGPTYHRLVLNIGYNDTLRVEPNPVLLGDVNEPCAFSFSSLEPGAALHQLGAGGEFVEKMQMRTLDSYRDEFRIPFPDYMKIDVDGMELRVLIGAEECLEHVRSLQVEIDDTLPASQQVGNFLAHRGFTVTEATRHGGGPISNVRFER